jgi:hypothetical protein
MKYFIAFGFFVLSASALAAELSFEQASTLSDRDEASLSPTQTEQLMNAQGQAGGESHAACFAAGVKRDLSPYTVIMKLDASGKVVRTWRQGTTPLAICFEREMGQRMHFKPPRAPFYTGFAMSWQP